MKVETAKEKVIRETWEKLGIKLNPEYGFDGWQDVNNLEKHQLTAELNYKEYSEIENNFKTMLCRPKSLQGIETNNGWISVKDELPKIGDKIIFYRNIVGHYEEMITVSSDFLGMYEFNKISHWKHYVSQPPIY